MLSFVSLECTKTDFIISEFKQRIKIKICNIHFSLLSLQKKSFAYKITILSLSVCPSLITFEMIADFHAIRQEGHKLKVTSMKYF
jgi:hypothetical protein